MPSAIDNPVVVVEIEPQPPPEVYHGTLIFAIPFFVEKSQSPVDGVLPVNIWGNHAPIPSPFKFIIICLAVFAEMKSQGSEFPFKTHPLSMNIAGLLFYGLASAAQYWKSHVHFVCDCEL
ncbi:unnamed protein product [Lactuca virosa]|uniref:Uncharacterized protein n=1 Tax=Lactuca virosa TaxID=75947 RepID=A0AAU9PUF5_9ASTR|nr:unnamed protein product [Lactuca virosa]